MLRRSWEFRTINGLRCCVPERPPVNYVIRNSSQRSACYHFYGGRMIDHVHVYVMPYSKAATLLAWRIVRTINLLLTEILINYNIKREITTRNYEYVISDN